MRKEIDKELLASLGFEFTEWGYYRKYNNSREPKFDVDPRKFNVAWTRARSYYPNCQILTLAVL